MCYRPMLNVPLSARFPIAPLAGTGIRVAVNVPMIRVPVTLVMITEPLPPGSSLIHAANGMLGAPPTLIVREGDVALSV